MATIEPPKGYPGDWVGNVFGTNTGNIYVHLESGDVQGLLKGVVRFMDAILGVSVFDIAGTVGPTLHATLTPTLSPPNVQVGAITVDLELGHDDVLRGQWNSVIGTGGMVALHRFFRPQIQPAAANQPIDMTLNQVVNSERPIGAIRMTKEGLRSLLAVATRDLSKNRAVITYTPKNGQKRTVYADSLLSSAVNEELREIVIGVHEPEPSNNGINRGVNIELFAESGSNVRAYGSEDTWVRGKAELVATELSKSQRWVVTTYKRLLGVDFGGILLLLAFAFLPDGGAWIRAAYLVGVIMILRLFRGAHSRLIPMTVVYLSPTDHTSMWNRVQTAVSSLLAFVSAIAVKVLSDFLSKAAYTEHIVDAVKSLLGLS